MAVARPHLGGGEPITGRGKFGMLFSWMRNLNAQHSAYLSGSLKQARRFYLVLSRVREHTESPMRVAFGFLCSACSY